MSRTFGGIPNRRGPNPKIVLMFVTVLLLTVFLILAVFMVKKGESNETTIIEATNSDVNKVQVLIPVRRIVEGEKLSREMFNEQYKSRFELSDGYVGNIIQVDGKFAKSLILPGQPLYADYLTQYSLDNPITMKIPDGSRAISISVDATSGVEGWIRPGSFVDVQWITKVSNKETLIKIVERAEVLSAEKTTDSVKSTTSIVPTTVTLLVSTGDADKIALARGKGKLNLVLRNPEEENVVNGDQGVLQVDGIIRKDPPKAQAVRRNCEGKLKLDGQEFCVCSGEMLPPNKNGKCE